MSLEQDRTSGPVDDTGEELPEPSGEERAARARVRRSATGMRHHEAKSALAAARKAARNGALTGPDAAVARSEVEEWERVTATLVGHSGPYDPAEDPFVQGEQGAREGRAPLAPHASVTAGARTLPHQR